MADNLQQKVVSTKSLLPPENSELGTEFEAFKNTMKEADPDGWQATLSYMIQKGHARLRVRFPDGVKTVYIRSNTPAEE